jgi:selenocysteine lyase/cysteine desulfurase
MERKSFIANTGLLLTGLPISGFAAASSMVIDQNIKLLENYKGNNLVEDESYWNMIRHMFNFPKDFINLENGYFSPQPLSTEQFHQNKEHHINHITSKYMRRELRTDIENTRKNLADFMGCDMEELVITRNTTEGLNTVISGYPWQKGDEVIIGNQDYGSMVAAFRQMEKRAGIVIKVAQIPLQPKSDEDIINAYLSLTSSKTKVIHLTHLINLSGQLLPAKKVIEKAHELGIEVIVDAAHSIAHIDFLPNELGADYLAASLHKWLCCPLGAGVLLMKKKHIAKIWPLMADDEFELDNIRKFEHQGTKPPQTVLAIAEAIKFHKAIGSKLKQDRLRYLKNYWVDKIMNLPGVTINHAVEEYRGGAIANIAITSLTPQQLMEKLWLEFNIFTVAIDHPNIKGVRVTPHLYTSLNDLDKMVNAIQIIVKS